MQDHLKERLTGAAILVVVVVLLVPELFHGRAPADGGAATAAAGPPVRSVTIDLGDAAGTRPLTENAPAVTDAPAVAAPAETVSAPAGEPAGAPTANSAAATPPVNSITTPPVKPAATPPSKSVAPAVAKPGPGTPGPSTAASAATSSTSPTGAPASASSTSNPSGGAAQSGWTVQLGSFARRDYADRMVKDAARKGFTVEVAGPDDRGLYRVRSPPRADRAAALALKQKMQASGFKPIVNKTP